MVLLQGIAGTSLCVQADTVFMAIDMYVFLRLLAYLQAWNKELVSMPSFLEVLFLMGLPFVGALLANSLTLLVILLAMRRSSMRASD